MIDEINNFLSVHCVAITRGESIMMLEDLRWVKGLSRDELKEIYNNWRREYMKKEIM